MKKAFLLFLTVSVSISLMAQLQRSLPVNVQVQAHPQPVIQQTVSPVSVKGNVTQGFESYTDFSLNLTPWTTIDVDGSATYGITNYTFLHQYEAMSFIVFNPASTTPPLSGDAAMQPHGGSKFAGCFASTTPPNNDWIISEPIALGTNGHLKFWVKSYTSQVSPSSVPAHTSKLLLQPGNKKILIFPHIAGCRSMLGSNVYPMMLSSLCWTIWKLHLKRQEAQL